MRLRSSISHTLQCIFSKSLAEGQVQDDWTHAHVTPYCVCCKQIVEWIEAFLSSRSQVVVLDGTSSDSVPVTSGVPQGYVLDPALFLLFTNDPPPPDTIYSQVRLFADDTVLYRIIKSDTDHHILQPDLDKLTEWAMAWDMHTQFYRAK